MTSQMERDLEAMRVQMMKDREERMEFQRQMQLLMDENRALRARVEKGSKEEEPKFSTPEESEKHATDPKEENSDWLRRRKVEAEEPQEAARPPFRPDAAGFSGSEAARPSNVEEVPKMSSKDPTMDVILKLMEGMQEIQKRIVVGGQTSGSLEPEVVRHSTDLPRLAEWSAETAPIDYNDWLLCLGPQMSDLSSSSEEWWRVTVSAAREWYEQHQLLSPIARLSHYPQPTQEMTQQKWARVERRASSLLMAAIPDQLREEVVASKSVNALGILAKGMQLYQPGGLAERSAILSSLESPAEASSVTSAISTLRRWLRWKRRAEELKVGLPDPTILVRGLGKLVKRILQNMPDLNFRLSLVRNTLMIDTVPSHESVSRYSEHLLAELEQSGHQAKKKDGPVCPVDPPKLKKFEAEKNDSSKQKMKDVGGDERPKAKCRFYLTDEGCRRGKECGFSHDQKDEKRRCYACGSVSHLSPSCPRKGTSSEPSPTKPRVAKVDVEERVSQSGGKDADAASQASSDVAVKDLLEEANRMLKSLSGTPAGQGPVKTPDDERKDVVERLQQQLNSLKTFKMRRLAFGDEAGLLDSGATHPLRCKKPGENTDLYPVVEVGLADGRSVRLRMSPGGSMLAPSSSVEPIVPLGLLTQVIGCQVSWDQDGMRLQHPQRGDLKVFMRDGCPHLSRAEALTLIGEIEDAKLGIPKEPEAFEAEVQWMKKLINQHAVLSQLPSHIKDRLVVSPGSWSSLPGNRHQRRRWKRDGMIVHLYAGPDSGFTLKSALKQQGASVDNLLEVDVVRGQQHDMLSDRAVYAGLIQAALEGKIDALLAGPNCRSRSLLRHIPVPGQPSAPRPIRRWGGEEFGIHDATEEEKQKLHDDDVLMWRTIFLYMVASYMRRVRNISAPVMFSLEQPASPCSYMPEVVSWWETDEWKRLAQEFAFEECTFNQGSLGGASPKPTTFGGSLQLEVDGHRMNGRSVKITNSSQLSRWAPGVMAMVASALIQQVLKPEIYSRALTWNEHLEFRHVPYRRDCRVCQESSQQCPPHRRVRDPIAGVLSIDTAGPLIPAYDLGGAKVRYFLVGVLTWRVPKGTDKMKETPPEDFPEDAPVIEERADEELAIDDDPSGEMGSQERPVVRLPGEAPDEMEDPGELPGELGLQEMRAVRLPGEEASEPQSFGPKTLDEVTELRTFKMALPMANKKSREVVNTVMEFVLRLRSEGYHVGRIHSDQGHEFAGEFSRWARSRGIYLTKTSGDDPAGNGRAGVSHQELQEFDSKNTPPGL